jgi:hypothetical protein
VPHARRRLRRAAGAAGRVPRLHGGHPSAR